MSILEEPRSTWEKRYKQRHYAYRDSHQVATALSDENTSLALVLLALAQGQAPPAAFSYVFGTNARAKINPLTGVAFDRVNWPLNCYAREVLVHCTQACFISLISLNPAYVREATLQAFTGIAPTSAQLIFEEPQPILANSWVRFYPTYAYGVIFWFPVGGVSGTLTMLIEANVEGTD